MPVTENSTLKELVDETTVIKTEIIASRDNLKRVLNNANIDTTNVNKMQILIEKTEKFCTDTTNGKADVASAITSKGVNTNATDTLPQMATNIRSIPTKEAIVNFTPNIGKVTATIEKQGFFTEFKLDTGSWQSGNVFENLNPVQSYTFYAKSGGYISEVTATTPKANQSINMPVQSELSHDKVTITTSTGEKIRHNGVNYTSPYTFTGLRALTQYQFYAYKEGTNTLNEAISNPLTVTTKDYPIYGFRIDLNNSNPLARVSYIKDAIGVTPAAPTSYGGWEGKFIFDRVKPCGFKDGKVTKYINPNDFSKYEDGTEVTTNYGDASYADTMIEFPKIYWKWTKTDTYIDVELSEFKIDEGFECLAHTVGNVEKDNIYIGAYLGASVSDIAYSIRTGLPYCNVTLSRFRSMAQANGRGYQQYNYYSMFMLQMLFVLMFKSTDSQTSLGYGYANGNSASIRTGGTYNKGMMFGETTGKQQMKFLGIEDFWGNLRQWVDGLYSDGSRNILISDNSVFNDIGSGYKNCGQGATSNISGYVGDIQGGNNTGFIIKDTTGSTTTKYADYGYLIAGYLPVTGGDWYDGLSAGAFYLLVRYSASAADSNVGSRLVYL